MYKLKQLVLSHSSLSSFDKCGRKLEFRQFYGDSPILSEEGFPAAVGKCLHSGYQNFLVHRDETQAAMALLMTYPHEEEYRKSDNSTRSLEACYSTLQAMINHPSATRYQVAEIKCRDGKIRPAIEVPFAILVHNPWMKIPVWFVGFIDAILFDNSKQEYLVVDIKTTRQDLNDWNPRFEFDEQTVPYGIILEHILGKKIVQFDVGYLNVYVDLMNPTVEMLPFTKTNQHIEDWIKGLYSRVKRIAEYSDQRWFPRAINGDTCVSFNRKCQFNEFCSFRDTTSLARMIDGEVREGLFRDNQEPWVVAELQLAA